MLKHTLTVPVRICVQIPSSREEANAGVVLVDRLGKVIGIVDISVTTIRPL